MVALFGLLSGPPFSLSLSLSLSLVGCLLNIVAVYYREAQWSEKAPLRRRSQYSAQLPICEMMKKLAAREHAHVCYNLATLQREQHLSLGQSCVRIRTSEGNPPNTKQLSLKESNQRGGGGGKGKAKKDS